MLEKFKSFIKDYFKCLSITAFVLTLFLIMMVFLISPSSEVVLTIIKGAVFSTPFIALFYLQTSYVVEGINDRGIRE